MPFPPTLYEDIITTASGHTDLFDSVSPGRLFHGNSAEPSIRTLNYYRMSAVDMLKHQYHGYAEEDHASLSSSASSSSSMSTSGKSRKPSHRRLMREIRRLRSENASLHHSINLLKSDLRHEQQGRQIAEACHRKYYEDSINTNTQLELEIMDQQDRIYALQHQLQHDTTSSLSADLFDDDPITPVQMDMSHRTADPTSQDEWEEEEAANDQPVLTPSSSITTNANCSLSRFTELASSYIRQALLSNLTSARTNLELDDLMLKYDPSPDVVLRTLSSTFVEWLEEAAQQKPLQSSFPAIQERFLRFWKTLLEHHVHNDDDEYVFLQSIEQLLLQHPIQPLVHEFHRLLIMLYKYDIVDNDAVLHWWHSSDPDHDTIAHQLRHVTQKFVEWVDENNTDSDDDIDDDAMSEDDSVDFVQDDDAASVDPTDDDRQHCPLINHALAPTLPSDTKVAKNKKSVTILV
ncbi:hypothetical protein DM01DRAFT_1381518 [Hesseltinella vesiculosa]|uniref:W2 domain-containing protein n=1 Tax=Hesseltinella vesiculosa TaxID=101127 RepID=A0A1X2GPX1_9FUNG|nr:hypothetical protein DM01DRAFT_1381518 [Hesseltinella vesiculosa]